MPFMLARRGPAVFRCLRLADTVNGSRLVRISEHARGAALPAIRNVSTLTRPTLRYRSLPIILRNSYASAAGRPKAHTGRASASKSKKTSANSKAKGKATTKKSASKQGKKTPKTKAKAAPKRKVLTDKQKEELQKKKQRDEIKQLREAALTLPKRLPVSAYQIVCKEQGGKITANIEAYKNLSLADRQRLDNLAKSNQSANKSSFDAWVKSHTPLQIKSANEARRKLRRVVKAKTLSFPLISDDRQVKRPKNGYMFFVEERLASGDGANSPIAETAVENGRVWKNMSKAEQEKYNERAKQDTKRYVEEFKSIYGEEPPTRQSKSKS